MALTEQEQQNVDNGLTTDGRVIDIDHYHCPDGCGSHGGCFFDFHFDGQVCELGHPQLACSWCDYKGSSAELLANHVMLNHHLLGLLKTMDIPEWRRNDIEWLRRNLPFNNSGHPDFARAWKLLGMEPL
jgi:hypothetical protein